MTIPELKQDQGQPEIGEERFQYLLQLMTTYEQNNIKRMQAILDEVAKYKTGMTTLSQTFMKMDDAFVELDRVFVKLEREMKFIMKLVGYSEDPDTGDFERPVIPERTKGKLAV